MKHLNKVIFINSASMRYEEISLDGPIHLAGKSGAGKTTSLRGILYFSTADQTRLGIDDNKVNFNQYYFPMINSHVVYEFKKEEGAFTVILTKDNHNRVQYAFVDAPYNRDWIVDPVTHLAASSWSEITKNIPQHIDRDLVITIKDYLNILWGCHPDKRYARYTIAVCKGYEDILRSQKNVFLGSGFSTSGFKSTIVRSLPGESPTINLHQLRGLLSDYENVVRDMSVWQKVAHKENCDVRELSDKIIADYYKYNSTLQTIRSILGQLKYALRKAEENLPVLREKQLTLLQHITKLNAAIETFEKKIIDDSQKIAGAIAVKERDLKDINVLKEKYKNIEDIRSDVETLPVLEEKHEALKNELTTRKGQHQDIESKYKQLMLDLNESHQKIVSIISDAIRDRKDEDDSKKRNLSQKYNELRNRVEESFKEQYKDVNERLESLRQEEKVMITERATLKATNLYDEEQRAAEKKISEFENTIVTLTSRISTDKERCRRLEDDAVRKEEEIKSCFEKARQEAECEKENLSEELQKVEDIISRYADTLYAWLEKNDTGWKETIGKVINESVLYQTDLHPVLTDVGNTTMYGVTIDTNIIADRPFTPIDYERRKAQLESAIKTIDQNLRNKAIDRDANINTNKETYSKELHAIREEIAKAELQISINSSNISKAEADIARLKKLAVSEKKQRLDKIDEKLHSLTGDITAKKQQLTQLDDERSEKLKTLDTSYQTEISQIDTLFKIFKKERDAEHDAEQQKYNAQREEYSRQKQEELSGKGVDMLMITSLENNLIATEKEIESLKKKTLIVHDYEKDFADKIVHEQKWQMDLQDLKINLERLQKDGENEKKKMLSELSSANTELDAVKDGIDTAENGIKRYDEHRKQLAYTEIETDIEPQETTNSVSYLLDEYKNIRESKALCMIDLKKSVKHFKAFFLTNLLNLPEILDDEEDYLKYANSLNEIISFKVINAYCDGKMEIYIKTLQGIRMSMDGLEIDMEKVKGVINDIDKNFRNAKLPEVVQEIRVRHAEMKDEMYDCLKNIKQFMHLNEGILPGVDFWTSQSDYDKVKEQMYDLLNTFVTLLSKPGYEDREKFTIEDMFLIEFKVTENGNCSGWVTGLNGKIGSDGTDMMIKLMLNIMLISRSIKKNLRDSDFFFHCILDESEKVHADYMRNIIDFCTERGIYLVLGSPLTIDPQAFRHNYILYKDDTHHTHIQLLVEKNI